jgi:glucose/mannose-6-phosphate isomerase
MVDVHDLMQDYDKSKLINVLNQFPQQCKEALDMGKEIYIDLPVNGIIFCGMGGSGLPGEILKSYFNPRVPVVLVKDYLLPAWANGNTLVFVISYSGNTEETLDCYKQARAQKCKIVCLSSGGKLRELAFGDRVSHIMVPAGLQPREAIGYQTLPLLNVLHQARILKTDELQDVVGVLQQDHKANAITIADKLYPKIPVIYASTQLEAVAKAWKVKINETAKIPAICNVFPELNHNEMVGFTNAKEEYFFVIITDKDDHPRIKRRMEVTKQLLQAKDFPVLQLRLSGPNKLARMFSALLLGSYVSYFLALQQGVDPTPIEMVDELKRKLG